jgi:hypothetical protein
MTSDYSQYSTAEVVELCARRDRLAWGELFQRFGKRMYTIPVRYRFGPDECWDTSPSFFRFVLRRNIRWHKAKIYPVRKEARSSPQHQVRSPRCNDSTYPAHC